jgi:hypothetical protein
MSKSTIVWKDWDLERFKEQVKAQLAENMEIVCVEVEQQARANMHAIEWRERFRAYRQKLLCRLIGHEVEIGEDFVEGRIGIREEGGHSKAGYFIEVGQRNAPAQPWLRPAVFENAQRIVERLQSSFPVGGKTPNPPPFKLNIPKVLPALFRVPRFPRLPKVPKLKVPKVRVPKLKVPKRAARAIRAIKRL